MKQMKTGNRLRQTFDYNLYTKIFLNKEGISFYEGECRKMQSKGISTDN